MLVLVGEGLNGTHQVDVSGPHGDWDGAKWVFISSTPVLDDWLVVLGIELKASITLALALPLSYLPSLVKISNREN